jgi:orotidine-5'-phosphate decarboxylase
MNVSTVKYSGTAVIKADERLIVGLDVETLPQAREIVSELGDIVSFFKIGYWLHIEPGIDDFATQLVSRGTRIFWDIKGSDIPETMKGLASCAARRKFSFLTIHGNGDVADRAILSALEGRGSTNLKVLMVTVLTSLDDDDVKTTYRLDSVEALCAQRASRAIRLGCDGVIASGREAGRIRAMALAQGRDDFLIVTPGIRPAGADPADQRRAATPYEAIAGGADYLVVARPIIHAVDRKLAARGIIAEMQAAFDERAG